MEELSRKNDIGKQVKAMDNLLQKILEVYTGWTTQMDRYEVSKSTSYRPWSVQMGSSGLHQSDRHNFHIASSES